jgi:hypothetical protein
VRGRRVQDCNRTNTVSQGLAEDAVETREDTRNVRAGFKDREPVLLTHLCALKFNPIPK